MAPRHMNDSPSDDGSKERLIEEVEELRRQLAEAEQTLQAIRNGEVDALVINGPRGEQVFSLTGADHLYRVIVETMNEAALTLSEQGTILYCNRRFCELMATPMETMIGRQFMSFVPAPQHARVKDLIARAENLPTLRATLLSSDGRTVPVQLCASPLQSVDGPSVCLVASDLSELEASAKSVADRTAELMLSQERLRGLATELNLAEQRERQRMAAELHDHLQQMLVLGKLKLNRAKREAQSLPSSVYAMKEVDEILSAALSYTRTLVADLYPTILKEHGLGAAFHWLADNMRKHDLKVTVYGAHNCPREIPEGQAVMLFQSVRELLLNTCKHAGVDSAEVTIGHADGQLNIQVRDKGAGFDLTAADPHNSDSPKFGVFSIRERMKTLGGSFHLTSTPGRGTTGTLILPLAIGQGQGGRKPEDELRSRSPDYMNSARHPGLVQETQPGCTQIQVLLVDDHESVRQGLHAALEAYNDLVVIGEAENGEEAVAAVSELRPHVVLMDINMPRKNGIEATAEIKAKHPNTEVIGLSVNANNENERSMLRAGAFMLLSKETGVEELYKAIRSAVQIQKEQLGSDTRGLRKRNSANGVHGSDLASQ